MVKSNSIVTDNSDKSTLIPPSGGWGGYHLDHRRFVGHRRSVFVFIRVGRSEADSDGNP